MYGLLHKQPILYNPGWLFGGSFDLFFDVGIVLRLWLDLNTVLYPAFL